MFNKLIYADDKASRKMTDSQVREYLAHKEAAADTWFPHMPLLDRLLEEGRITKNRHSRLAAKIIALEL